MWVGRWEDLVHVVFGEDCGAVFGDCFEYSSRLYFMGLVYGCWEKCSSTIVIEMVHTLTTITIKKHSFTILPTIKSHIISYTYIISHRSMPKTLHTVLPIYPLYRPPYIRQIRFRILQCNTSTDYGLIDTLYAYTEKEGRNYCR